MNSTEIWREAGRRFALEFVEYDVDLRPALNIGYLLECLKQHGTSSEGMVCGSYGIYVTRDWLERPTNRIRRSPYNNNLVCAEWDGVDKEWWSER